MVLGWFELVRTRLYSFGRPDEAWIGFYWFPSYWSGLVRIGLAWTGSARIRLLQRVLNWLSWGRHV